MIRFLFRLIGLMCLAAAFIFVIYDGMKSIADQVIFITKAGEAWNSVHSTSQQAVQAWLTARDLAWAWDQGVTRILDAPVWVVFIAVGAVFILVGRKRRPLIGYARS
jgi:hypothetical protein